MVVALVAGALLTVPATPALAAPSVTNVSASPSSVEAGKTTKVSYTLTFDAAASPADVSFTSSNPKLTCIDGCFRGKVNESGTYDATFKLADDAADGTAQITVKASDSTGPIKQTQEGSTSVTLVAKAAPPTQQQVQTVKLISGKVTNSTTGEPVPNATVMLLDSQQHRYTTLSDGNGNYRFSGSTSAPIAPGRIDLGAVLNDVKATKALNANAGQTVTGQRINLPIKVEATPSASPSASAEAVPSDEPTDEATDENSAEPSPGEVAAASNDESGGFGSWLLILLGGLFVAVGVGTIVLLYMRRKNEGDDGDDDLPAAAAAGAVPIARGAYRGADDQTRVVNGMGAGPAATMVGGASLSDAPTMMHRPVVDDVPPDPYGAPPAAYGQGGQPGWAGSGYGDEAPGQGGYGGGNGYGNAPASGGGYGDAPASGGGYGNAPASGGGYGSHDYGAGAVGAAGAAGAAGYPPAQGGGYGGGRYDEPTGRYTGDSTQYAPPADPYPTSTYQPPADQPRGYGQPEPDQGRGYGQPEPSQYGRAPEPGNGYGAGGGYGAPASGGYDNPPTGGYDNAPAGRGYDNAPAGGGYDGGQRQGYDGYDQRGGYGQSQQGEGYGQQGGYGQEPPQQRAPGYDNQGYEQGGYYGDPAQAGRGRPDAPPQDRANRRLDWLDD